MLTIRNVNKNVATKHNISKVKTILRNKSTRSSDIQIDVVILYSRDMLKTITSSAATCTQDSNDPDGCFF